MADEACCTCASLLAARPPSYSPNLHLQTSLQDTKHPQDEKTPQSLNPGHQQSTISHNDTTPPDPPRQLLCCNRKICSSCLKSNPRFKTYCPFCQISNAPTSLPQGLRDPPSYTSRAPSPIRAAANEDHENSRANGSENPPSYSSLSAATASNTTQQDSQQDVTHHLRPTDTIASISLAYNVPAAVLRAHNGIYSDHLLSARRTISIPRSHYSGPSLSPDPVDSEEETERKMAIRRFMVATKCTEYDVAELYLGQANGDVNIATERFRDDERWERENPLDRSKLKKNKGKRSYGGGLTGQLR